MIIADVRADRGQRLRSRRWQSVLCLLLLGSVFGVLAGCSRDSGRIPLSGSVTFDGAPLAKGHISFRPQAGTKSPTAGAQIADGRFSIDERGSVLPGRFRVEITASRPVRQRVIDSDTGKWTMDALEQYIPAAYNSESKLEAEVTADGPNEFSFDLKTK